MDFKKVSRRGVLSLTLPMIFGAMAANGQTSIERVPAFPGAEGFGRYTTGGRGGNVYYVTNLEDYGKGDKQIQGSLRWALSQTGPRTILFKVSGTIHLQQELRMPENTTIAGQTAPGDGICVADYPVSVGSNSIVRYMRFRLGNKNVKQDGADGWDGLSVMDSHDVIVDHCSVSWSIDECCSILGNSNTTLQWSIVSQALVNAGHSKGAHGYGGNWGGSGASFHHNLVIHHGSRTPRLGPRPTTQLDERMDMRNNVIYNFGGNGCYGGEGMTVNIVNNYYKPGPGSPTDKKGRRIAGVGVRTNEYCTTYPAYAPALHLWGKYYVTGNVNSKYADVTRDNWNYGMYNQIDTSVSATDGTWNNDVKKEIKLDEPMDFMMVTTHSAEDAYERVLDFAGASLSQDAVDALMVSDTREGKATYTGKGNSKGMINSQEDMKPSGAGDDWSAWPTLESLPALVDTDGDGMPDEWEEAYGLNPESASDRNILNEDGYTMLEVYLAEIVEDITYKQNLGGEELGYKETYDLKDYYELSMDTKASDSWSFEGGLSLNTTSYREDANGYIRYAYNRTHTINLPVGVKVYWARIEGYGINNTSSYSDAYLTDFNGQAYDEGLYALPKGGSAAPKSFDIDLDEPATNKLTMYWTGNNPALKIKLYTSPNPAGIEAVNADVVAGEYEDNNWYNLQGIRVEEPTQPGLYIHNRKVVVVK